MIIDSIKKRGVYGLLFSLKLAEASRVTTLILTSKAVVMFKVILHILCF